MTDNNTSPWKWCKNNSNIIEAILGLACIFIPSGNIVKGSFDLWFAYLKDKDEVGDDQDKIEFKRFITNVRPIINEMLEIMVKYDIKIQDLTPTELNNLTQKHPDLKENFDKSLMQLSQNITQTLPKISNPIINDRYKLIQKIGKGGQGEVYLAWDERNREKIAIKILLKELSNDEAIKIEYNIVSKLKHDNMISYLGLERDTETRRYYIVMDYIEGKNLRQILLSRSNKPFSLKEALDYLSPIAYALDYAHKNNLMHSDIKPENILIRDSDGEAFLTDFGLSSKIRQTVTMCFDIQQQQNSIRGTLPYMAPEQYKGQRTEIQTDTWALGIVLYELLAGTPPFNGRYYEHFERLICKGKISKIKNLSNKTNCLISKMLTTDLKKRPAELTPIFNALQKQTKRKITFGKIVFASGLLVGFFYLINSILEIPQYIDNYIIYDNNTVEDTKTGLMWKRCAEGLSGKNCLIGTYTLFNYSDASNLKDINYAGYSNWRLPTDRELESLIYCSNGAQIYYTYGSCEKENKNNYQVPTINQKVFPNTSNKNDSDFYFYRTSSAPSKASIHNKYSMIVNFKKGYLGLTNRINKYPVRLVRSKK